MDINQWEHRVLEDFQRRIDKEDEISPIVQSVCGTIDVIQDTVFYYLDVHRQTPNVSFFLADAVLRRRGLTHLQSQGTAITFIANCGYVRAFRFAHISGILFRPTP